MYWLTRSVMTSQADDHDDHGDERGQQHEPDREAVDAEVVVDVEALDPRQLLLTNCIAAVPLSNAGDQRQRDDEARPATPSSAIQRTAVACSSRPTASSTTPARIGSQMARLSKPMFSFFYAGTVAHGD